MTSPTDPPHTLKEGRSPIIQRRGQTRARKRASADEGWRGEESPDMEMIPALMSPYSQAPRSTRTHKKKANAGSCGGRVRGLMIQEPLQLSEGRHRGSSARQQYMRKATLEVSLRWGGGSKCHQHWLNPPPKPTGMLSTHCSICTQKKGHCRGDRKR